MGCSFRSSDAWRLQSTNIADGNNSWGFYHRHHYIINKYSRRQQDLKVYHGYPAHSHHDKIPPWWENVSNDKGGNMSVTKSHHTWKILLGVYMSQSTSYNNGRLRNVHIFKLKPLAANMLSALQLHSFPHLADPLGEVITSINITLILARIIYSYKTRTSTF